MYMYIDYREKYIVLSDSLFFIKVNFLFVEKYHAVLQRKCNGNMCPHDSGPAR